MIVPRFIFHASLASFSVLGWALDYLTPNFRVALNYSSAESSIALLVFSYGLIIIIVLTAFLWFETIRVLKQEKI